MVCLWISLQDLFYVSFFRDIILEAVLGFHKRHFTCSAASIHALSEDVIEPNHVDSGFVAEVPFQFCSYDCIAYDDKNEAYDENIIVVFYHAIKRGQDAHDKDDDDQSFSLHFISL